MEQNDVDIVIGALDESIAVWERCKEELVEVMASVATLTWTSLAGDGRVSPLSPSPNSRCQ